MLTIWHLHDQVSKREIDPVRNVPFDWKTVAALAPEGAAMAIVNGEKILRESAQWEALIPVDESVITFVVTPGDSDALKYVRFFFDPSSLFISFDSPSLGGFGTIGVASQEKKSPSFGFDFPTNNFQSGGARPITYGEMLAGGTMLMAYRQGGVNRSHLLTMLIGLSEGPIAQIGADSGTNYTTDQDELTGSAIPDGILFDGVEAKEFEEVTVSLRMGEETQTVMPGFEQIVNEYEQNFRLDADEFEYETVEFVNGIEVNIRFPGGLYKQLQGGDVVMNVASITLDIYATDGITLIDTDFKKFKGARRGTAMFYSLRIEGLNSAKYIARIRRKAPKPPGWKQSGGDDVAWDQMDIISISEIQSACLTYPGMALLGVSIQATEQLSGAVPRTLTTIRGAKVLTDASIDNTDYLAARADNPAYVKKDILTRSRWGGGHTKSPDDADATTFDAYADFCDELIPAYTGATEAEIGILDYADLSGDTVTIKVDGSPTVLTEGVDWTAATDNDTTAESLRAAIAGISGLTATRTGSRIDVFAYVNGSNLTGASPVTSSAAAEDLSIALTAEKRFVFNGTFDIQRGNWDAALLVGDMSRAAPFLVGDLVKVMLEKTKPVSAPITEANMREGSIEKEYINPSTRANQINVKFLNSAKKFEPEFATAEVSGLDELLGSVRPKEVELIGCTRLTQARRHAFYKLRVEQMTPRNFVVEAGVDLMAIEPGDVCRIAHDLLDWGVSGRIVSNSGGTVTLDRTIAFDSSALYTYTERLNDDTINTVDFTHSGTVDTIPAASLPGMSPALGIPYIISKKVKQTQSIFARRIESIDGAHYRRIQGPEYVPDIYTDDAEEVTDSAFVASLGPAPNFASALFVSAETSNKDNVSKVTLNWTAAATPAGGVAPSGYAVYLRSGSNEGYRIAGRTLASPLIIKIEEAQGANITFLVQTRQADGQFTSIASSPTLNYQIRRKDNGQSRPKIPEAVTGLTLVAPVGNESDLHWAAVINEAAYADGFGSTPNVAPAAITPDKYLVRVGGWNQGDQIYNAAAQKTAGSPLVLKLCQVQRTIRVRAKEDGYHSYKDAKVTTATAALSPYTSVVDSENPFDFRQLGINVVVGSSNFIDLLTQGRMENATVRNWKDAPSEVDNAALLQVNKEEPMEFVTRAWDLGSAADTHISVGIVVRPFYLLRGQDDDLFGTQLHQGPYGHFTIDYLEWTLHLEYTNADPPTPSTTWTRKHMQDRMNEDVTVNARHFRYRFKGKARKVNDPNVDDADAPRKVRIAKILIEEMRVAFARTP